jgi:hypothetical protein
MLQTSWVNRKSMSVLVLALGLVLTLAASAHAVPQAGTLTVNSYADTNTSDSVLTLREALLIARGGTGATGVNRTLSDLEKAQLSGCAFGGSSGVWTITGGCGAAIADTINFNSLAPGGSITLGSALPLIDDTQPTSIYGGLFAPTIDAGGVHANYGLRVTSNGNHLQSIGVRGAWISDFSIEGDNNTLFDVWAWDSNEQGVTVSGSYNTIDSSRLGVNFTTDTVCNQEIDRGNIYNGVYIMSTATHATIQDSYLGCNGMGVYIVSSNIAGNHAIGPNNRIGVNQAGTGDLGNLNSGVYVGMNNNVVMSNTIANNNLYGLEITGNFNYAGGNVIRANTAAGVELRAWASNNVIGKLSFLGTIVSNTITSNIGHGILITDTVTPPGSNLILGNYIGVSANGTAAGNGGNGILIYGGHDTYVGGSLAERNIIGSNSQAGVNLAGGAYNSQVKNNYIGINASGTAQPNGGDGVALQSGAHDNIIGAAGGGNTIEHNGGAGVLLSGASTINNLLNGNTIITNTLAGVALRSGANLNYVRTNLIRLNGNAGVLIDGGANNNRIGEYGNRALGNVIGGNATDGIYIGDSTTALNAVVGNLIGVTAAGNAADPNLHTGVTLDSGAHDNQIGEYTTERNVIAGNAWDGVLMINGVHDNYVWTNDIGLNRDYAPVTGQRPDRPTGGGGDYLAIPNGGGIAIVGSYSNTIGGYLGLTDVSNFISHNTHTGIYLTPGISLTQHNVIGSNVVSSNGDYGVLLDGGNTAYNTITRTLIYRNGLDGIGERNSAALNVWSEVGINDNGGLGIDKNASNDGQNIINAPNLVIDSINKASGVVRGHANPSILGAVKVELYRVSPEPSGFGEGGVFLGRTTTDVSGSWTITDTSPLAVRGCYTAFVTESQLVIPFSSSEFSANTCRVFLPVTTRQ